MSNFLFPSYTKSNPSPAYTQLIEMYRHMHEHGMDKFDVREGEERIEAKDVFPGRQALQHAGPIKTLCDKHKPETLFDFGAGKSGHYNIPLKDEHGNNFKNLQEFWNLNSIVTYEPALGSKMPRKKFDAVICTDVIEHVFIGDVFWTIEELFKKARKFVYLNISCDLTKTLLPNGENVHVTVRKPNYWYGVVDAIAARYAGLDYMMACGTNPIMTGQNKKVHFFQRIDHNSLNGKFTT